MRLTKKGKYAVSAMLDIALFEDKEKSFVKIQDISKRQRIPNSYLEQILRNLRQEGLLLSVTGPNGGYRLSRDSEHISIADSPHMPSTARVLMLMLSESVGSCTCIYARCRYRNIPKK